jgi:hypothetical protein
MLNQRDLEVEINEALSRIDKRSADTKTQFDLLDAKIATLTKVAWSFVVAGIVIASTGVVLYITSTKPSTPETSFSLNLLGDFLAGGVASVWSLAGLFFIYVAFLGQKQQLLNQQLEIMYSQLEVKYTRLELEGQKNELIEQNKTLRQQRFENTFFQLLRNHQDIVNNVDIRSRSSNTQYSIMAQGRDCFKTYYSKFAGSASGGDRNIEKTLETYLRYYHAYQSDLGHYFRNMYHIIKFVDAAKEIPQEDKYKYTSLLRALLSSYELTLLFYNGLGIYGKDKFKPLIEKYALLKNLDSAQLIDIAHKENYDSRAFASSEERMGMASVTLEESMITTNRSTRHAG